MDFLLQCPFAPAVEGETAVRCCSSSFFPWAFLKVVISLLNRKLACSGAVVCSSFHSSKSSPSSFLLPLFCIAVAAWAVRRLYQGEPSVLLRAILVFLFVRRENGWFCSIRGGPENRHSDNYDEGPGYGLSRFDWVWFSFTTNSYGDLLLWLALRLSSSTSPVGVNDCTHSADSHALRLFESPCCIEWPMCQRAAARHWEQNSNRVPSSSGSSRWSELPIATFPSSFSSGPLTAGPLPCGIGIHSHNSPILSQGEPPSRLLPPLLLYVNSEEARHTTT